MINGTAFLDALEQRAKIYAPSARQNYETNKEICAWLCDPLAQWAEKAYGLEVFEEAASGYVEYCLNVSKAKAVYEREGNYTPDDLPTIKEKVYEDSSYMTPYMWAAVLIYAFWPSMAPLLRLYRDDFLGILPNDSKILELACGHGVLGLLALMERKDSKVVGYDIGSSAIDIANRLAICSGFAERANFKVQDVLELPNQGEKFDGVVSAMIAEHLEDPRLLIDSVAGSLASDGIAYFSTALESPQPDHIYEFNRESEVLLMVEAAGLRVKKMVSERGPRVPNQRFSARSMAMILEHR